MSHELTANNLNVHFHGVRAVDGVDLELRTGETLGLIGPNGAGKTTLLNAISGFQVPTEGTIAVDGVDVTRLDAVKRARLGVVRTFQNIRTFKQLTVFENVELGGLGQGLARRESQRRAIDLLTLAGMEHQATRPSGSLSHGEERMLGVLRAAAMSPKFLLLDEPAAGLNEAESGELVTLLRRLPGEVSMGILIVEHDMSVVMGLSDRVQVIDYGKTIAVGTPDEVQVHPAVRAAYLGSLAEAG